MGNSKSGCFPHTRMEHQCLFDIHGRNLLPPTIDDFLDSPHNGQEAIDINGTDIPGRQPAILQTGSYWIALAKIAWHQACAADENLTDFSSRQNSARFCTNDKLTYRNPPDGANLAPRRRCRVCGHHTGFAYSVHFKNRAVQDVLKLGAHPTRKMGGAGCYKAEVVFWHRPLP